ncbi:MAG: hypothetical protein E7018_04590 [Alphaproteobacteria bacterium]|nr:hypothetical protein [Alphaproteobacteria bacterium]
MPLEKEDRNTWINAIVAFAKDVQKNNLYEHCRFIPTMLRDNAGICLFKPTNAQVVQENVSALIKSSDDKSNDAGALAWRFLRACQEESGNIDFRLQHKMVDFLSRTNFYEVLTAKEKLKLINFVGYKYSTDSYKLLHQKLGDLKFSQDKDKLNEEKKWTVKVFHLLLDDLRETKERKSRKKDESIKNKLTSARSFLEAVAKNGDILQDATFNETKDKDIAEAETLNVKKKRKKIETGKVLTISSDDKKELFEYMKTSGINFSDECMDYFGHNDDQINPVTYLRIVMNKMKQTKSYEQIKNTETEALEKLANLLEKGMRDDKEQGKEVVLEVAQAYAKVQNGEVFHEQMTTIFKNMVAYHDYSVADVNKLCDALDSRGSNKMQKMIKAIRNEHDEYHPEIASTRAWGVRNR